MLKGLNPDTPAASKARAKIAREKPVLACIYNRWYSYLAQALPEDVTGPVLEIGAGGSSAAAFIPGLLTSEVLPVPGIDLAADGQRLPFHDRSLRGIVMLDVLHHLPRVEQFFREASRCIKPGGVIAMVEPWVTPLSRIVYRYLHPEPFSLAATEWHFQKGGPLSQANTALPWIVFQRDHRRFATCYPALQVRTIDLDMGPAYLLTGGVSFRSVLPDRILQAVAMIERELTSWAGMWALFARIVLVKRESIKAPPDGK